MKLTLPLKLAPSTEQRRFLLETMARCNEAASYAARVGFEAKAYSQVKIHRLCYGELRTRFGLGAQAAVRSIGKAVEVFARDKKKRPTFRPKSAVAYDERLLTVQRDSVSLWTLQGRQRIPLVLGEHQKARLPRLKGQADLVCRGGELYLHATLDVPEEALSSAEDFLGVDLGIVNLATDSDGGTYTGSAVERVRQRHHRLRQRLQAKGTRGAKKRLRKLAGREARFRRHQNHAISKALVLLAKGTARGLALEDLKGLRERTTVRRKDRARHASWAFAQLRAFVEYKACYHGVPVVLVDPRNTSRTCSVCGCCDKQNRKSQSEFECLACHHRSHADLNAARNIRARAVVNQPQYCRAPQAQMESPVL